MSRILSRPVIRTALFAFLSVCLSACASNRHQQPHSSLDSIQPEDPIVADIAQAFQSGGELHVKVYLEAKTVLKTDEVAVKLTGLAEGVEKHSVVVPLSSVWSKSQIRAGEQVAVSMKIPSDGVKEYQVQCSWGEEGLALSGGGTRAAEKLAALPKPEPSPPVPNDSIPKPEPVNISEVESGLILENVELERKELQCKGSSCPVSITVVADLVNTGSTPISDPSLALGIAWVSEGRQFTPPEEGAPLGSGEELIELTGQTIKGGGLKHIRVAVDRPLPQVPGGEFLPHLRILRNVK